VTSKRLTLLVTAILAGAALAAASLLPIDPPDVVPCGFLRLTGYPCPFCGMTRGFTAMGHGQPAQAVAGSPLAAVAYLAVAALLLVSLAGLIRPQLVEPLSRTGADLLRRRWFWILVAGAILANWGYRLALGLR
jgi:hypothetical protein